MHILVAAPTESPPQSPSTKRRSVWSGLQILLSFLPGLAVASFYAFAARAAILIGYWPRPMEPDPKSIDDAFMDFLYRALPWLMGAALLSVPLWLGMMFFLRHRFSLAQKRAFFALYAVGWIAFGVLFIFDPGETLTWFID